MGLASQGCLGVQPTWRRRLLLLQALQQAPAAVHQLPQLLAVLCHLAHQLVPLLGRSLAAGQPLSRLHCLGSRGRCSRPARPVGTSRGQTSTSSSTAGRCRWQCQTWDAAEQAGAARNARRRRGPCPHATLGALLARDLDDAVVQVLRPAPEDDRGRAGCARQAGHHQEGGPEAGGPRAGALLPLPARCSLVQTPGQVGGQQRAACTRRAGQGRQGTHSRRDGRRMQAGHAASPRSTGQSWCRTSPVAGPNCMRL